MTILVGPNNTGKSTILRDIEKWFNAYRNNETGKIIKHVEVSLSDNENEYNEFEQDILEFQDGEIREDGAIPLSKQHIFEENHDNIEWYNLKDVKREFEKKNVEFFRQHFLRYFILRLDGESRFKLLKSQAYARFRTNRTAKNYLTRLYESENDQLKLGNIVYEEFGLFPYLQKSAEKNSFQINIMLSKVPVAHIPCSTLDNNKRILEKTLPIKEFGDGVKCFIAVCLSILSFPFRILLIDEPEAYLHPPTSYELGKNLSIWSQEKRRTLVVSTHSPEFLMGCLHNTDPSDISIIRLTYEDEVGKANALDAQEIKYYARDPLMRSTDVLNALFHRAAIVTEGPDDKVIYHQANNKLLNLNRGIENTLFLNANGKDVVYRIVKLLRKIGVPTAAIYDLDILKHQENIKYGTLWNATLMSANVDDFKLQYFENERKWLEQKINEENNKKLDGVEDYFTNFPINKFHGIESRMLALIDELKKYGIFIVPIGELEQWLKNIKTDSKIDIFRKLLQRIDICEPSNIDIWSFLDDIRCWISNKNRKGIF